MRSFTKLKSELARTSQEEYVANTFIRRRDAEEWAIDVERSIDRGAPIRRSRPFEQPRVFSDLIALHLDDLAQVGKPVRRSKSKVLKALLTSPARVNLKDITREKLNEFGRKRAAQGAGPATLAIDFSFVRAIPPTSPRRQRRLRSDQTSAPSRTEFHGRRRVIPNLQRHIFARQLRQ